MTSKQLPEKEYIPWLSTAMAAVLADCAGQCSWPIVLAVGAISLLLCRNVEETGQAKWLSGLQWIGTILVSGEILGWTYSCWPGRYSEYAVPLALTLLSALAADKGCEIGARTCNVLRYGIFMIIGLVLASSLGDMKWRNLYPEVQMENCRVVLICLLPAIGGSKSGGYKQNGIILLFAVIVSAIVSGTVGIGGDLYRLSRSVALLGTSQRFESITAAAVTLSYFILLTFLYCRSGILWNAFTEREENMGSRLCAALGFVWYLSNWGRGRYVTIGAVVIWVVLPLFLRLKKLSKNNEKRC